MKSAGVVESDLLARLQDRLLDLLDSDYTPEQIIEQLKSDPQLSSLHAYLDSFEPRLIAVGKELVRKWGRKN